jgi:hypothetical protein
MTRRYVTATRQRELTGQLVARDLDVLKYVSDLRFVTGAQLTRLCFADDADPAANARAARRALLRLTRLGLLDRLPRTVGGVRAGSAGYVYCLGPAGQRLAIECGWQPERRRRRSLTPGTLFLRHALQVSELHVQLTEGDRSRRFELLELVAEPSCHRTYDGLGGQRQTLKPDSYARLGVGHYEDSYFFEVDRGTEGSRTIVRQLSIYIAYHRSGQEQAERGVFPRVLWLTPDERRAEVIAACVAALPRAERELFAVARFDRAIDALTGTESLDPDIPPMI